MTRIRFKGFFSARVQAPLGTPPNLGPAACVSTQAGDGCVVRPTCLSASKTPDQRAPLRAGPRPGNTESQASFAIHILRKAGFKRRELVRVGMQRAEAA